MRDELLKEHQRMRQALQAVEGLISCSSLQMSGESYLRFITTGQNSVAHLVQKTLREVPDRATRTVAE